MPDVTRTRPCPNCGSPAAITWLQTMAYGADYPVREDVSGFTCSAGCRIPSPASGPSTRPPTVGHSSRPDHARQPHLTPPQRPGQQLCWWGWVVRVAGAPAPRRHDGTSPAQWPQGSAPPPPAPLPPPPRPGHTPPRRRTETPTPPPLRPPTQVTAGPDGPAPDRPRGSAPHPDLSPETPSRPATRTPLSGRSRSPDPLPGRGSPPLAGCPGPLPTGWRGCPRPGPGWRPAGPPTAQPRPVPRRPGRPAR